MAVTFKLIHPPVPLLLFLGFPPPGFVGLLFFGFPQSTPGHNPSDMNGFFFGARLRCPRSAGAPTDKRTQRTFFPHDNPPFSPFQQSPHHGASPFPPRNSEFFDGGVAPPPYFGPFERKSLCCELGDPPVPSPQSSHAPPFKEKHPFLTPRGSPVLFPPPSFFLTFSSPGVLLSFDFC